LGEESADGNRSYLSSLCDRQSDDRFGHSSVRRNGHGLSLHLVGTLARVGVAMISSRVASQTMYCRACGFPEADGHSKYCSDPTDFSDPSPIEWARAACSPPRQAPQVDPKAIADLRAFYDLEDRKRERREIAIIVISWIVFAGALFALCWTGLRSH
jgi:hypothetical protein